MDMTGQRLKGATTSGMGTAPQFQKEVGPGLHSSQPSFVDALRASQTASQSQAEQPANPWKFPVENAGQAQTQNFREQAFTIFNTPNTAAEQVGLPGNIVPTATEVFGPAQRRATDLSKTQEKLREIQQTQRRTEASAGSDQVSSERRAQEKYTQERTTRLQQERARLQQVTRGRITQAGTMQALELHTNELKPTTDLSIFAITKSIAQYVKMVTSRKQALDMYQQRSAQKSAQRGGLEGGNERANVAEMNRAQNEAPHELNDILGE